MNAILQRVGNRHPLLWLTVIFPLVISILYFGVLASDTYISESEFVVRSPDKPSMGGLGILLKSSGFANAGDEIYAAQKYLLSRDALQALNRRQEFEKAYGASSISFFDRFDPMGNDGSFEDLYKYYQGKVAVEYDTSSSIATLKVRAFSAQDAQRFNKQLLAMAEATVNRLNTRGREDLIQFAQVEVDDAQKKAGDTAVALASFRNRQGVADPEKQATIQLQMISKLQDELIATRTQLRELRAFAPQNPQIPVLETRAAGIADEIDHQSGEVAGSPRSLSSLGAQYQRLQLDDQFAQKQLVSAMASLETARNEARRKQAYIERIVQPNLPDKPLEPRRLRGIISTLLVGLAAWGILSMLIAGMLEHRD
jgi:capsular polysaccharide transport system permease protein